MTRPQRRVFYCPEKTMPAGTIALTNGSVTVTGSGTSFTTELKPGDFIYVMVGGAPYTLVASAIGSATRVTLATAYDGPTASGLAWIAAPALMQAAVTQKILNDFAAVARGRVLDFQNWQKIYSSDASVTVTRPDRTTFTGPSWGYLANQLASKAGLVNGVVPVYQGGSGSSTAAGARANFDMKNGYPISEANATSDTIIDNFVSRFRGKSLATAHNNGQMSGDFYEIPQSAPVLWVAANDVWFLMSVHYFSRGIRVMSGYGASGISTTRLLLDNLTTTIDANGFIKKASPVIRLCNSPEKMPDGYLTDATLSGVAAVNTEAEGVYAERVSEGVYKITGSAGLHNDGWTVEIPQDINGNRLCFVETATGEDGEITVSVFRRKFDINTATIVAGEPIDIPEGRWIDIRLLMPDDSVFNKKMKEAEQYTPQEIQEQESH